MAGGRAAAQPGRVDHHHGPPPGFGRMRGQHQVDAQAGEQLGDVLAAVERAQLFIRKAARGAGGQLPPGAAHFTAAKMTLAKLRAVITANLDAYAAHEHDERALSSLDFQSSINLLKVEASELAVDTVMSAMRACGLSGYRNDGDFSIGRLLRDVLSAPIMINNERILANISTATLMSAVPASLRD